MNLQATDETQSGKPDKSQHALYSRGLCFLTKSSGSVDEAVDTIFLLAE